jgi:hypothetical protein
MPPQSISELTDALAVQAVETQSLLDAGYESDLAAFQELLAATPPEFRELLRPLAPQRQLVSSLDLSTSLTLAKQRETEFALQAYPVNLNYVRRHSLRSEDQTRMTFSVVQYPPSLHNV